ncbi:MAG TPA: sodium-dependent transporter [Steroidobacteraceae bacterium]|nr:sodium-dependent transporter [Steroidobacteraceae bacterium]
MAQPAGGEQGWSSRLTFVLAAAGSAVGLGNLWRFPYVVGENGGAAFVLVYLACIAVVGAPILMAEIAIGRSARHHEPAGALADLAADAGRTRAWGLLGAMAGLAALLFLSFYSVIAGWSLAWVAYAAQGAAGAIEGGAGALFERMTGSPSLLVALHLTFVVLTAAIVVRGVHDGIERAVRVMMPGLLVILVGLIGYAAVETDQLGAAARFLFTPDFSRLDGGSVLEAMGQAFFTLSVGVGGMLVYGSFLRERGVVGRTALGIAAIDTSVALLAGLAIFPIVFSFGVEPSAGPGLVFVSLPNAFAALPGGRIVGTAFFVLVAIAALTSTISLLELLTEIVVERLGWLRRTAVFSVSAVYGAIGVAVALSFNVWSDVRIFGRGIFDFLDHITSNLMLPLGGAGFALFAGWVLSRETLVAELGFGDGLRLRILQWLLRIIAPAGVLVVLVAAQVG